MMNRKNKIRINKKMNRNKMIMKMKRIKGNNIKIDNIGVKLLEFKNNNNNNNNKKIVKKISNKKTIKNRKKKKSKNNNSEKKKRARKMNLISEM